jgi:phenylalanyl-tRNA synthetase beta chain
VDVSREEDLIEDVARHYGYDRLPTTLPALRELPQARPAALAHQRTIRRVLTAAGFSEAQTYAFVEERAAAPFRNGGAGLPIAYPLSEKHAVLRPSLLPGLIDAAALNRSRGRRDVRMFEVGSVFRAEGGERRRVGLAWTGAAVAEHWSGDSRSADLFDLTGAVSALCRAFGSDAEFQPTVRPELVPGRSAAVVAGGAAIGFAGQLVPALADVRGLPAGEDFYVAELDLEALGALAPAGDLAAQALPRFPAVVRDVAVLVRNVVPAAALRATVRSAAPPTLIGIQEFDRYEGPNIPEGHVSVAFHLTFRAPDRTLVDAEVQQAMDAIVAALGREQGAVQR